VGEIQEVAKQKEVGVKFAAQIKRIQMTIDACGDKGGKVEFIFRDEGQTLERLNGLMKMDSECVVIVQEMK
jgi:ABC-type branched-subunit amino acid transport system substrate-binding protein